MRNFYHLKQTRDKIKIKFDPNEKYCVYLGGIHSGKSLLIDAICTNDIYRNVEMKKHHINIFFYSKFYQFHNIAGTKYFLDQIKNNIGTCCFLDVDLHVMLLKYINDSLIKRQQLNSMNRIPWVQNMCRRYIHSYYFMKNYLRENEIAFRSIKIAELKGPVVDLEETFKQDIEQNDLQIMTKRVKKLDYEWSNEDLFQKIKDSARIYKKVEIFFTLDEVLKAVHDVETQAKAIWKIE